MANPTTNYSFAMPTNTDLVKDLPADFEVFGQAVDTKLKALNPSTTLGDIEYRSATADTNTRLGIGTSGQVLTVSGGVPAWGTISSGGMTLLSTTTLSGTSTTISGISGSYKDLKILVQGVTLSAAGKLYIMCNSSNTASGAGGWDQYQGGGFTTVYGMVTNTSWTSPIVSLYLNNYANTSYAKTGYFSSNLAGINDPCSIGTYIYNSSSAITEIKIGTQLGTSTFNAGQVLIYGVS